MGITSIVTAALRSFAELRAAAQSSEPKRVAIVCAEDEAALTAAADALRSGIARPQLLGDIFRIRSLASGLGLDDLLAGAELIAAADAETAARTACKMAATGESEILLKGHLRTDELLRSVLAREAGLRTGRLLSDVLLYEDVLSGSRRLVGITDGGLNVLPTLEQKRDIVRNAIEVMRCIGLTRPNIAIMSASEAVTDSIGSTVDAAALAGMGARGEFGEAVLYGPLALDNALLPGAAAAKGITHPTAGHADCMVVPNIESGNLLGKAVKYLGGSQCAHVVVGARVPVLIPSRVESPDDKVNSIALGVLYCAYGQQQESGQ